VSPRSVRSLLARERLIAEGTWDELRAAVSAHHARWAKPVDGGIEIEMDYVAIIGEKPARSKPGVNVSNLPSLSDDADNARFARRCARCSGTCAS
jgi:hypothetical protein